tara:strand:+ start:519 stop:710 length:192 start_codon:yes stop_codon:yes gene_type:complete
MKVGDLVTWSHAWLASSHEDNREQYRNQVGVLSGRSTDIEWCWIVAWSNGKVDEVHKDYLVLL